MKFRTDDNVKNDLGFFSEKIYEICVYLCHNTFSRNDKTIIYKHISN